MTSISAPDTADAVVIGAGHNGLVAAALLADAGWDVVVVEAQAEQFCSLIESVCATGFPARWRQLALGNTSTSQSGHLTGR